MTGLSHFQPLEDQARLCENSSGEIGNVNELDRGGRDGEPIACPFLLTCPHKRAERDQSGEVAGRRRCRLRRAWPSADLRRALGVVGSRIGRCHDRAPPLRSPMCRRPHGSSTRPRGCYDRLRPNAVTHRSRCLRLQGTGLLPSAAGAYPRKSSANPAAASSTS